MRYVPDSKVVCPSWKSLCPRLLSPCCLSTLASRHVEHPAPSLCSSYAGGGGEGGGGESCSANVSIFTGEQSSRANVP